MRSTKLAMSLTLGTLLFSSCTMLDKKEPSTDPGTTGTSMTATPPPTVPQEIMDQYTSGWPEASQSAAREMILKYGQPTESTASMLIWRDQTPFKRIVVYKEEVPHQFPFLHQDVLEHVVEYKIIPKKLDEVSQFDGSITFDRTRGEMSSRSDKEEMNILALNLAHEVMSGRKGFEQARLDAGKQSMAFMNGNSTVLTESLAFGRQMNAGDPDENISGKINWAGTSRPKTDSDIQAQEEPKKK